MIQFERCTDGLSSIPCPCTACTPAPTQDDEPMLFYQGAVFYDEDLSLDATEDAYYAPAPSAPTIATLRHKRAVARALDALDDDIDALDDHWGIADIGIGITVDETIHFARAMFRADGWAYLP